MPHGAQQAGRAPAAQDDVAFRGQRIDLFRGVNSDLLTVGGDAFHQPGLALSQPADHAAWHVHHQLEPPAGQLLCHHFLHVLGLPPAADDLA